MKEYYYYERDENNRPIVTVCLLQPDINNPNAFARGVAICNDCESPIKKRGRAIAKGRALKAINLINKVTKFFVPTKEIDYNSKKIRNKYDGKFEYVYHPSFIDLIATDFEKRLLIRKEK